MRCPLCPSHSGIDCEPVPSVGPEPCSYLFLGAGPSKTEARTRIPYSGLAGEELTGLYLPLAGLHRDPNWTNGKCVHLGNASRCWDQSDRTPPESRVLSCTRTHLPDLLASVRPQVIVLMGGVTQKLVTGMKIRLDTHHGIPQWTTLLDGMWEGWVTSMYEPALGMRETTRMTTLINDFRRLGMWLEGTWTQPEPEPEPELARELDYRLVETRNELLEYLDAGAADLPNQFYQPAGDTESHGPKPWSVQFSRAHGTGRMILAGNGPALRTFADWIRTRTLTLHNAPGDLDVLESFGIVPGGFDDTMQQAFQLCSLPQGLKPLAYRLLGAVMRSWEDVVWPASVDVAMEWMRKASAVAERDLSESVEHKLVRGRCTDCGHQHTTGPCKRAECVERGGCTSTRMTFAWYEPKPGAVENVLKHIVSHTEAKRDDEKPYQPWKNLAKMKVGGLRGRVAEEWEWSKLEIELGTMPILGIGNCDEDQARMYSVGDADFTGRVAEVLRELRDGVEWRVAEEDVDV